MIGLNLLAPNKKKELRVLQYFVFAKNIVFITLIFVIALSITLLLARLFLENTYIKAIESNTLTTKTGRLFGEEIKRVNVQLNQISDIQNDFYPWSEFVVEIIQMTPESIQLESLSIASDEKELNLVGFAPTREALKTMISNLNASGYFEMVEEPFDANFQRQDINFNLDITFTTIPPERL